MGQSNQSSDNIMALIDVVVCGRRVRKWHRILIDRLRQDGYDVHVCLHETIDRDIPLLAEVIARCEAFLLRGKTHRLAFSDDQIGGSSTVRKNSCVIDLTAQNDYRDSAGPVLHVYFDGQRGMARTVSRLFAGDSPVVDLCAGGELLRQAKPMIRSTAFLTLGLDDVLARTISLIESSVRELMRNGLSPTFRGVSPFEDVTAVGSVKLAWAFATQALPRVVARLLKRSIYRSGQWRVGFRFVDGPGVAESKSLSGKQWNVLGHSPDRFYADPFPFRYEDKYYIFMEELLFSEGKGAIAVCEFDSPGSPGTPRRVLEQPYHLSYPQVLEHQGSVYMLPEMGASGRLSLFRADKFPDSWTEDRVLIEDTQLYDSTFFESGGLLWILAAHGDGLGSTSDLLVAYFAERLEGPWKSHPANPIAIDKAAARPGGRAVRFADGRLVIPIQDGTDCYGGGLGIAEIIRIDRDGIELSKPIKIETNGYWPHPRIHTLNRHARLETIDGIADSRRI